MPSLNSIGQRLVAGLTHAKYVDDETRRRVARAEKVNVVGAGGVLTAAYEQLRNAAENTEEHLLLQNAIRRFYKRLFIMRDEALVRRSGGELVVELTLAGYIPNDSLLDGDLDGISKLAIDHYQMYEKLQKRRSISLDTSTKWILDTLSVGVARLISPHATDDVFVDFAYQYLDKLSQSSSKKKENTDTHSAALFAAIHKALLKSDTATIRTDLLARYGIAVNMNDQYVTYNKLIDKMLESAEADHLYHLANRQGAPLRIVRRMIESRADVIDLLPRREVFLEAFEQQVAQEYSYIIHRVNRAIVRSVIFLVITKFLIGIAIEVPYDLWVHKEILWWPLIINLLFPPLYMVALRLTLNLPGYANTAALVGRIDSILYGSSSVLCKQQSTQRRYGPVFSIMYIIFGLAVFSGVTWLLLMMGFALVHIGIFFMFISAASFLGFRLSRLIRELEVVRGASNGFTVLRDFIYLPFVVVGRWMSDKYAQVNIVSLVLDMLIELPLKTVLRLIRQWSAFIDDRKDNIS